MYINLSQVIVRQIHPRLAKQTLLCLLAPLCFVLFTQASYGQSRVEYEISFPNLVHHEAEITATFIGVPPGKPLEVWMSRSSPGRYALTEFEKNVYSVKAFDAKGAPLTITRPDPYRWDVTGQKDTVKVTYTLFADYANGTFSGIDETHAHLNMPATFIWAKGMEQAPIKMTFHRPIAAWKIATQLATTSNADVFTAPNMQYFMDSITELSDFRVREWTVRSGSKTYTYRLAIHDAAPDQAVDEFTDMIKKVVSEEIAIFGEPADYDYGTYTFIACYTPYVFGDGMEHRNSTSLTSRGSLNNGGLGFLGTVAHEFFHSWNIKRLRPRSLEPFDFERANMSGELWLGEGFTNYFGPLTMRRAGFGNDQTFLQQISFPLSFVINSPARQYFSAMEMSMQAPFVDGGVFIDPTNWANTNISYYTWGSVIALGLDLTLREKYRNLTLDDYMRALWQGYGRPFKPYTLKDLETTLTKVTGDAAFARDFFQRYVEGKEVMDYEKLLAPAGLMLVKAKPGTVWSDAGFRDQNGAVVLNNQTEVGGPFYRAGLDRGDHILSLDGKTINKAADVQPIIAAHKPGDSIQVEFEQRGMKKTATIALTEDPQLQIITFESAGQSVTEAMREFRRRWLNSRVVV